MLKWHLFVITTYSLLFFNRPSEPFFVQYLVDDKGFTIDEVTDSILPMWIYGLPFTQVLVTILLTFQILCHKEIILLGMTASAITIFSVVFPPVGKMWNLRILQFGEFLMAFTISSIQAYTGIKYHMFERKNYAWITAITRGCFLLSHGGAVVGQICVLLGVELKYLFIASIVLNFLALLTALCFPRPEKYVVPWEGQQWKNPIVQKQIQETLNVQSAEAVIDTVKSIENYSTLNESTLSDEEYDVEALEGLPVNEFSINDDANLPVQEKKRKTSLLHYLAATLKSYQNHYILLYSIFLIFATAIHALKLTYYQPYFKAFKSVNFNGFLIAAAYAVSMLTTQIPAYMESLINRFQICLVIGCSFASSFVLLGMGWIIYFPSSMQRYVAYVLFILHHALFEAISVIAYSRIASAMKHFKFGAVFSLNAVVQTVVQVLMQLSLSLFFHQTEGIHFLFLYLGILSLVLTLGLSTLHVLYLLRNKTRG